MMAKMTEASRALSVVPAPAGAGADVAGGLWAGWVGVGFGSGAAVVTGEDAAGGEEAAGMTSVGVLTGTSGTEVLEDSTEGAASGVGAGEDASGTGEAAGADGTAGAAGDTAGALLAEGM
jgi:hypothetical protein